jgi:hypothetical protein
MNNNDDHFENVLACTFISKHQVIHVITRRKKMELLCHLLANINPDTPNMRLIRHKSLVLPTLTRSGQTTSFI